MNGHFDAVVILACFVDEHGVTCTMRRTVGNWHAQNGMLAFETERRKTELANDVTEAQRDNDV